MTTLRSLRSRLVFGSLLWAAGLLGIAAAIATTLVHLKPHWAAVLHNVMFMLFAVVCLIAGLTQIRRGLSPFNRLRERLSAVRDGRERRVDGSYPSEVQPLVNDLNALLDDRERRVAKALAKAGDLAHGLKTPLAVLAHEADALAAAGHSELATAIGQQVDRMRRQVEYHLVQARAAATDRTTTRVAIAEVIQALVRTLKRLYAARGLAIEVDVPADPQVQIRREDLDEILGNVLDNACKWARARVVVRASWLDGRLVVTVDDDGPGLVASMRDAVLQRGVRADEAAPGSGFGLAIARDLLESYGGDIALEASPLGGLRARMIFHM
jgi:signal transduction histidine kinase